MRAEKFALMTPVTTFTLGRCVATIKWMPAARPTASSIPAFDDSSTDQLGDDGDNGPALAASLNKPTTLRIDASGDLYVEDSGNHRVRRISPSGFISSAKSLPESKSPYFIDGALRLATREGTRAVRSGRVISARAA